MACVQYENGKSISATDSDKPTTAHDADTDSDLATILEPFDPQDVENSFDDFTRHQDQFVRTAYAFHVRADSDDK